MVFPSAVDDPRSLFSCSGPMLIIEAKKEVTGATAQKAPNHPPSTKDFRGEIWSVVHAGVF